MISNNKNIQDIRSQYEFLFNQSTYLVYILDLEGNFLDANKVFLDFIRIKNDELNELNFKNLLREHQVAEFNEHMNDIITQGPQSRKREYIIDLRNVSLKCIQVQGFPIKKEKEVCAVLHLANQISGSKKYEVSKQSSINNTLEDLRDLVFNAYQESSEKFKLFLEAIPDTYLLIKKDTTILEYRGTEHDFYIKPGKLIGKRLLEIIPQKYRKFVIRTIDEVMTTQKSKNIEFEYQDNNQLKYFEARFLYFTEDKIMVLIRDITERKNAELLEKQELKRLQEIDRIKNDLITRLSHELKTPLTSIFAALEYVQDVYNEDLNVELKDLIKIINRGSNRLKSLIDDLMEIYHIELNSLKLNMETTDIIPTIKKSVANAQGIINKRKQQINVSLPDKKILKFDKEKMETVITNLINNAAKNTPQKGSIFVSVEENDEWVEIKVRDTGVGFTEEEKNMIFKKFGKVERYGQNYDVNIDGPGLGLYLAREIVRLHNGEIKLFSEGRNKGSTFVIRLKNVWLNSFFNYI